MTDTLTITLAKPIEAGGKSFAELQLREPKANEVLQAEMKLGSGGVESTRDYQTKLLSMVTSVPVDSLGGLRTSEFGTANRFLQGFVNPSTKAPDTSTQDAGDDDTAKAANPPPAAAGVGNLTIALPETIEWGAHIVSELELRELTLAEMRQAEKTLTDFSPAKVRAYQIMLVALSSELPRPLIGLLPVRILDRGAAYVQGFFAEGRPTTSS
jgi:hypothetical protein